MLNELKEEYDILQKEYGAKDLDAIYNGGCSNHPNVCFVFMNPTKRNVASTKNWTGIKAPWLGSKIIWNLFNDVGLFDIKLVNEINAKKPCDWDYKFSEEVYNEVINKKYYLTNLGKCTQDDARPLPNKVFKEYLDLLLREIDIVKPKIIITFGNQVSSIILDKKISVSQCRKLCFLKEINGISYKIYPVYYPVGNGRFNMDKSIEDIKWIMDNE